MASPTPGRPVRGSTTGRPLMAALDLFGRRWTLRVVWELNEGSLGFRSLQQRCDNMSSSVLRQRLLELVDACLVEQTPDGRYALTSLGKDAYRALRPLVRWSDGWAAELAERSRPGGGEQI
ncbi:winged helix-turn-helix transcriptional regulator [Streptomyces platensis]|uniref:winged helix-turn-helix transcriptional regulator n=1 Tax=Streptomyces platensis TaxID=58346 RepID=UPI0037A8FA01